VVKRGTVEIVKKGREPEVSDNRFCRKPIRHWRCRDNSLRIPAPGHPADAQGENTPLFLSGLGYYTPTRSNPLITMGNLLGGMALLGLLWWLMQRDTGAVKIPAQAGSYRSLARGALCLVMLQIVLGGWSSANYASASCPGLLQCDGAALMTEQAADVFNPIRKIELDSSGQVVRTDSLGLLSMAHRLFALLTAGYLAWMVRKLRPEPMLAATVLALSVFSISQIMVGVGMIWLQLPLLMVTLHNALAAGLLLGSINLLHRLTPAIRSRLPG
jgi:cytochrome c oxidase assembly protein subunit 15